MGIAMSLASYTGIFRNDSAEHLLRLMDLSHFRVVTLFQNLEILQFYRITYHSTTLFMFFGSFLSRLFHMYYISSFWRTNNDDSGMGQSYD